jgi:uncharacterized membrane protein
MDYEHAMSDLVKLFELLGVAILVVASALAFVRYALAVARGGIGLDAFLMLRAGLGRGILLGLEVLVMADIIRTIVVDPTLSSALSLGLIVLVRIVLSFAIDMEVDGVVPWRKAELKREEDAGAS